MTPPSVRHVAATALTTAIVAWPVGQAQERQQPSFRVGVEVVSLNVTVTTPDNRYVIDLSQDDFQVYEDGVKQDLIYYTKTPLPIALALLLDTSASMEEKLSTAQEAATGFARNLRPQDQAQVIDFDSRVKILQDFTNDTTKLVEAIGRTSADGSTSLHNAIYISLKELRKNRAQSNEDIKRQAIVVLSDGEDTSSLIPFEEVLELAKRSETAIYCIGLRSKDDAGQRGFKEADFVLRQLAQQTGGRVFFPNRIEDLAGVYDQIAEELSSQYTLGYTSKNVRRDGSWRRVVVKVDREGLTARTKQGYYAPTSP